MSGPLHGVKVIEIASIGPGPFAAMLLSDLGAEVVRIDRSGGAGNPLGEGSWNFMHRGRRSAAVDLKHPEGRELVLRLCASADALIEGFRPGVMERLGLGPDAVAERNPRLVYGRMTGSARTGRWRPSPGTTSTTSRSRACLARWAGRGRSRRSRSTSSADFGGGGMLLALGVVAAILEARGSGRGRSSTPRWSRAARCWPRCSTPCARRGCGRTTPGTNLLDSGAHFYEVYATSDGGHVAVGALEPQFYAALLRLLELDPDAFPQWDQPRWPEFKARFAEVFATRTRDEWAAVLEGEEACATAVLALHEAPQHPHNVARGTFVEVGGKLQPAPAPRFSRTPGAISRPPAEPGADTDAVLRDWGIDDVAALRAAGAVSGPE